MQISCTADASLANPTPRCKRLGPKTSPGAIQPAAPHLATAPLPVDIVRSTRPSDYRPFANCAGRSRTYCAGSMLLRLTQHREDSLRTSQGTQYGRPCQPLHHPAASSTPLRAPPGQAPWLNSTS